MLIRPDSVSANSFMVSLMAIASSLRKMSRCLPCLSGVTSCLTAAANCFYSIGVSKPVTESMIYPLTVTSLGIRGWFFTKSTVSSIADSVSSNP